MTTKGQVGLAASILHQRQVIALEFVGGRSMDCDQVFEILTRGPFPSGDPDDPEVEAHLEVCPECWHFAVALRPAIEVFEEAVPPAESRGLPGYRGSARPAAHLVAELTRRPRRTVIAVARPRVVTTLEPSAYPIPSTPPYYWLAVTGLGAAIAAALIALWIQNG